MERNCNGSFDSQQVQLLLLGPCHDRMPNKLESRARKGTSGTECGSLFMGFDIRHDRVCNPHLSLFALRLKTFTSAIV